MFDNTNCTTNRAQKIKTDREDMYYDKRNMSDYFRSTTNRATAKKAREEFTNKIQNEFNDFFSGIGYFEGTMTLKVKEGSEPYQVSQEGNYMLSRNP